ncbi:hypothetical protein TRAPUB_1702 [Trametes pubescens]|uniref:WLM domain-containing protein n=1 Tax=Trametes pubescens TaxID=154538 RepID=A0A1M2VIR0_TRAPU|nr:hypothetical protein TRAPUB_1702 [Trametes pubescens]
MVHVRINEKEANPNPHVNFIAPLRFNDAAAEEEARQLLRALAAQVRPIMKTEGFVVNSLEEVRAHAFAGGSKSERGFGKLVLRGENGAFLPTPWLLSTLCHECGGAQSRARPTSLRRRRRRLAGPSNHTGAQTAKRRKAGSRVTAQGTFQGSGKALNEDVSDEERKKAGAGFRKKAASKRAREERALAAERRLLALQGKGASDVKKEEEESDEGDEDYDDPRETDQDRRRVMLESTNGAGLDSLKASQRDFFADFILPPTASSSQSAPRPSVSSSQADASGKDLGTIELSSDEEEAQLPSCDVQSLPKGGTAATASSSTKGKDRAPPTDSGQRPDLGLWLHAGGSRAKKPAEKAGKTGKLPLGALVQEEIQLRKRESLGMSGSGRRLGDAPSGSTRQRRPDDRPPTDRIAGAQGDGAQADVRAWSCQVCTLYVGFALQRQVFPVLNVCRENEPQHLACAACATPRGQGEWSGNSV